MNILDSNFRLTGQPARTRPPAVAGMFYPQDRDELETTVRGYLDQVKTPIPPPKAVIAPHAGYIYSGPVAASVYASLIPVRRRIEKVVLLGPAHRVYLEGLALPDATVFATPLGDIPIDRDLVRKIKDFPQVCTMASAHAQEHSLEVHLPFLQIVLEDFSLLPLVVGEIGQEQVAEVLAAVWGGDETLIVISSDLSHYHDYRTARQLDAATSTAIKNLRLQEIGPNQACGCRPMRGLLYLAGERDMEIRILDVRNSGDTAGGRDQVVGYGAYSVHYRQPPLAEYARELLAIARRSIEQGFHAKRPLQLNLEQYPEILRQPAATFVTLKIDSKLRGCIGTTQAIDPLVVSVADSAYKAAFQDPRFKPLTETEFPEVDVSISVLTTPVEMKFTSEADLVRQLKPGVDGLIIESGARRATFLPEVWDSIPDATDFLKQLKLKAGMNVPECPKKAWRYYTQHFSAEPA
jgi:hypothetical protein